MCVQAKEDALSQVSRRGISFDERRSGFDIIGGVGANRLIGGERPERVDWLSGIGLVGSIGRRDWEWVEVEIGTLIRKSIR